MAISIPIISEFDGKGIKKAIKSFKQMETASDKLRMGFKVGAVAGVAAFAAIGTAAFQAGQSLLSFAGMAADDEKGQKQLALSIKASTKATDKQIASVESWIDATQRAVGVADDELRPAFARIVRSTGNLSKAQKILKLALDVSAATGKPLMQVVNGLSKSYEGSNTALNKLGLGYSKAQIKAMSFADIQKDLTSRFGGSALDAANTYEGVMRRFRITVDELKESIGYVVMKPLQKLAESGVKIFDAFGKKGAAGALAELKFQLKTLLYDETGKLNQAGQTLQDLIDKLNTVSTVLNTAVGYAKTATGIGIVEKVTGKKLTPTFGTISPLKETVNAGEFRTIRGAETKGVNIVVNVQGDATNPVEIGRKVYNALQAFERRNGGR